MSEHLLDGLSAITAITNYSFKFASFTYMTSAPVLMLTQDHLVLHVHRPPYQLSADKTAGVAVTRLSSLFHFFLFGFTFLQGFILNHLFAVLTTWPHLQQTAFQLFPWLPWWSILPQWQHQQGTFGHTLYIDKMMLKGQAVHQDKLNVTVGLWKKKQAGDLQPSV